MEGVFKFFTLVSCWLAFIAAAEVETANPLLVETANGLVQGYKYQSRRGDNLLAFTGIKFAEPPTGENRFQAPVPKKPWSGVFDATKEGSICPQTRSDWSIISEDCLWLNVVTKKLTGEQPVFVWIFGGGFVEGNATFDPQYILERDDVVLVSIQYRLGPLGFFTTSDSNAPGNAAFKDQNLALKWVRDNIRAFGGNPNLVTIFGQSSGSKSVASHIVSPLSSGLFHRAIAQSGTVINDAPKTVSSSIELAEKLGCSSSDTADVVKCLQGKTVAEIIDQTQPGGWEYAIEPASEGAFIAEDPRVIAQEGRFNRVPIIAGYTNNDNGPIDAVANTNVERFANYIRQYQDLYYYRFNFAGRYTKGAYDENGKPKGQAHGDDLIYLFVTGRFPIIQETDYENIMVQKLTGWWTQFAKTGNPNNPSDLSTGDIVWAPSNSEQLNTFVIV